MSEPENEEKESLAKLRAKVEKEPIGLFLGMRLVELTEGHAKVVMKLKPEYRTFNDFTFGGIIMSIDDQAFACATNSMGRPSIASQFNIHFIAAPGPKDELIAECQVVRKGNRVDIAETTVTNQQGKLIAITTSTAIPIP